MIRWFHLPLIGVLALLAACADNGIDPPQLSQADIAKQTALTACKTAADTYNRPIDTGDTQLFSLPGEPYYPGPDSQTQNNRSIASCMAAKGYSDYRANAS